MPLDPLVDDRQQRRVVDQQHRLARQEPVEPGRAVVGRRADREPPAHPACGVGLVDPAGVEQQPVDPAGDRAVHPVARGDRLERTPSSARAAPRRRAGRRRGGRPRSPSRTAAAASSSRPTHAAGRPTAARTTRARSTVRDAADVDAADVAVAERPRQRLDGAEAAPDVVLPAVRSSSAATTERSPSGRSASRHWLDQPARVARSSASARGVGDLGRRRGGDGGAVEPGLDQGHRELRAATRASQASLNVPVVPPGVGLGAPVDAEQRQPVQQHRPGELALAGAGRGRWSATSRRA